MEATLSLSAPNCPIHISAVDRAYHLNRSHYQECRQTQALRLRRQLVRRRAKLQNRLRQVLSPGLLIELDIQVMMDSRYLRHPDFVAVFEDAGQQWTIYFQPRPFGGRWFFRSSASSKLYSCSFHHLETQLCYALGQCRLETFDLHCA
ncbi:MAG: hypothetical protein AAGB01_07675 [Cyanobacteria bacterium P01_F01_bin.42]